MSGQFPETPNSVENGQKKVKVLVAQSGLTCCNPMDCSLPGCSVRGISQAITLKWTAIPFSRGYSQSRDQTQVSCIVGRFFTVQATRKQRPVYEGLCIFMYIL